MSKLAVCTITRSLLPSDRTLHAQETRLSNRQRSQFGPSYTSVDCPLPHGSIVPWSTFEPAHGANREDPNPDRNVRPTYIWNGMENVDIKHAVTVQIRFGFGSYTMPNVLDSEKKDSKEPPHRLILANHIWPAHHRSRASQQVPADMAWPFSDTGLALLVEVSLSIVWRMFL